MNIQDFKKTTCDNLAKQGILNNRISETIYGFKKPAAVSNLYKKLTKEKRAIQMLFNSALKKGVAIDNDLNSVIANLDVFDIKAFRKSISDKLHFINRQADCIRRLKNKNVPPHVIQSLAQAKNLNEIDAILEKLPPILLVNAGVMKTKHGDTYFTKKSIKPISTPMRD
jgi:hypothetical protein